MLANANIEISIFFMKIKDNASLNRRNRLQISEKNSKVG